MPKNSLMRVSWLDAGLVLGEFGQHHGVWRDTVFLKRRRADEL
jgi:hypothetical protein